MSDLVILTPAKPANILGTDISVDLQPTRPTAKMLPDIVNGAAGTVVAHNCSRTGCTTPITAGQSVKIHPSSGRVFHEVAQCSGTLSKNLPKQPRKSDAAAEQLAAENITLKAQLAELAAAVAEITAGTAARKSNAGK